jgi:hypothetical protein
MLCLTVKNVELSGTCGESVKKIPRRATMKPLTTSKHPSTLTALLEKRTSKIYPAKPMRKRIN